MALNTSTFKTRALSAVIFVIIVLGGLFINQWSFYLLFLVVHCGCWFEYLRLAGRISPIFAQASPRFKMASMTLGIGFLFSCIDSTLSIFSLTRMVGMGWMAGSFILWLIFLFKEKNSRVSIAKYTMVGWGYLSVPFGLLFNIRSVFGGKNTFWEVDNGLIFILVLIASLWLNDTMQYVVGSLIGKTPFSKISPKKTWEGTIGGIFICVVTIAIFAYFTNPSAMGWMTIIAGLAAVFGTIGDLAESKLKRIANVKDSGNIMPGHGGFLDRFDSLIFAIPFVWTFAYLYRYF